MTISRYLFHVPFFKKESLINEQPFCAGKAESVLKSLLRSSSGHVARFKSFQSFDIEFEIQHMAHIMDRDPPA